MPSHVNNQKLQAWLREQAVSRAYAHIRGIESRFRARVPTARNSYNVQ